MADADWDNVTRIGTKARGPGSGGVDRERVVKGKSAINAASRSGAIIGTEKKYSSSNAKVSADGQRLAAIDRTDEIVKPKTVGKEVGQIISRRRQEVTPKLTQSELAKKIQVALPILQGFESGTAAPDQEVFNKLERALNVKLRGADIGAPKIGPKKK
ncbi:multiprotein-bridging factor 1 [Exophiala xenobiotica]|nr:multiprotein-bridging factor 1 [Exophiala xenobiotica]KAK5392602.1 multiprotein-bridging factor 1 [Exophiala xenobiotica]KAK5424251.1 multiprotein-bridging factor 1 [Exophiala xenobiotica]KAK5457503.1 multiprotein-bridging factor 1 [Exophiala xenobiotica]KAK5474531.1 multiprotein-bridging factor 1 [Exophiala xenobiotica]